MHRGNSVVAICLEFRDIDSADPMGLDGVDVDDEAVL